MHFTIAVFTNTTDYSELEDLLTPMLEGNEDYFEFCPSQDPVDDEEAETWGLVKQDGVYGYIENPNAQFDYWDAVKKPVSCSEIVEEDIPYAFVTIDGVWESCDDFVSTTKWKEYWEAALERNPNAYVTYCDCHI